MTEMRKVYKPEEKMKILLEGLNGTIQISGLCMKYGIKPVRFYSWKEKLIKNSAAIFDDRGRKNTSDQQIISEQKKELERPKGTIAEIASENLDLKKKLGTTGQGRGGHEIDLPRHSENGE